MNIRKKIFLKWFIISFTLVVGITSVFFTILITVFNIFDNKKQSNIAFSNEIPNGTPYEKIHNLTYSLCFQNTGDPNSKDNDTPKTPYNVFGTGWLLDWREETKSRNIKTWYGYFGTNLHVADGLLNSHDNEEYVNHMTNDKTEKFFLGKYDISSKPNSILSSVKHNFKITYVYIEELPKTEFAAINFYNNNYFNNNNYYIDFSVLEIAINYYSEPNNELMKAQNAVFDEWINTSMETIKNLSQNDINKYLKIVDYNANFLLNSNAYIGGYPYYETYQSPIWNINEEPNVSKYNGQNFDTTNDSELAPLKNTFSGYYMAESWKYDYPIDNYEKIWNLKYHNKIYYQSGLGFVVNNSNLKGGSSGSILMNKDNEIMGIYWGSISRNNIELSYGLTQALRISSDINYKNKSLTLKKYDLIKGNENMSNSYYNSLQKHNKKTYFF